MAKSVPIFCPKCDSAHRPESLLMTEQGSPVEGMIVRCPACLQRYRYENLLALRPRMVKTRVVEKQPPNTIPVTLWVYPEVLATLQDRYPENFMTTMTAILTAIADPDTLLVEGEHGRALKQSGVLKGRDLEGLGPYIKQLVEDIEAAKAREKVFGPLFAMMQMLQGQSSGQANPMLMPMPAPANSTSASSDSDPFSSAMLPSVDAAEPVFVGIPKPTHPHPR